jgi:Flp pilus assembly protein TadG
MSRRSASPNAQRGVVAIELAFIIPVIVLIVALTLLFGRAFWQYNVLQKAGSNAMRYLASVSAVEMTHTATAATAVATARQMVIDAATAAGVEPVPDVNIMCRPSSTCGAGGTRPATIVLSMPMLISDQTFFLLTWPWLGATGSLVVEIDITVPYAN